MRDITPTRRGVLRAGVGIAAGLSLADLCRADEVLARRGRGRRAAGVADEGPGLFTS